MDKDTWWEDHKLLSNFTKAEIQSYGMLELDGAHRPTLTNPIHPIFSLPTWYEVHAADYTQLRPCLRLASRFITEPQLLPFWHALLFAQRVPIPRNVVVEPESGNTLYSFHRIFDAATNSYALSKWEIDRTEQALASLSGSIAWTMNDTPKLAGASFTTATITELPVPAPFAGMGSLVAMDRRFMDAYIRPDITISQKLRLQFYIATAIVHEVSSHVIESVRKLPSANVARHFEHFAPMFRASSRH